MGLGLKSDGVRRVPGCDRSVFLFSRLTLCHPLSSSTILSLSFTSLSLPQVILVLAFCLSRLFSFVWLAHVWNSLECLLPLP